MTVYLYSGTPGSGKSLHQAMDIFNDLKYAKPVITNFEINPDIVAKSRAAKWYRYVDNDDLTPAYLMNYARDYWANSGDKFKEDRIRLYLDECSLLFNSRDWNSKGQKGKNNSRNDWLKFFSQHRKFGFKITIVAQNAKQIDRQLRDLVEFEVVHRKLTNMGWRGYLLNLVMGGVGFVAVTRWFSMKERLGAEWLRARKKYFSIYDSYKVFDDASSKTKDVAQFASGEVVEEVVAEVVEAVL